MEGAGHTARSGREQTIRWMAAEAGIREQTGEGEGVSYMSSRAEVAPGQEDRVDASWVARDQARQAASTARAGRWTDDVVDNLQSARSLDPSLTHSLTEPARGERGPLRIVVRPIPTMLSGSLAPPTIAPSRMGGDEAFGSSG